MYHLAPMILLHISMLQGEHLKNKCISFIYKFSFPTTSLSVVGGVGKVNNKHVYDSTFMIMNCVISTYYSGKSGHPWNTEESVPIVMYLQLKIMQTYIIRTAKGDHSPTFQYPV